MVQKSGIHKLIWSLSHFFAGFDTSQVVQDFFHQQYECSSYHLVPGFSTFHSMKLKSPVCWFFPSFDKVRWQLEESLCSTGNSQQEIIGSPLLCASTRRQKEIIQEDFSSDDHPSVTDGIPLQSVAFSRWSESFFHWTLMIESLRRHNLFATHVFFFRAIYRPFQISWYHPFTRVWNSYLFLGGGGRVFPARVQKSVGKTPTEVSTFVKMWFWSTRLPALPVQRKTQLGVEPLQCHWVRNTFFLFEKKEVTLEYIMENTKRRSSWCVFWIWFSFWTYSRFLVGRVLTWWVVSILHLNRSGWLCFIMLCFPHLLWFALPALLRGMQRITLTKSLINVWIKWCDVPSHVEQNEMTVWYWS